jgi:hypothetical protein
MPTPPRFDEEITDFTLSGQANTVDGLPAYAPANQIYYVVSENAYYHYTETEDPGAPGTNIAQWQRYTYKYECATNDGSNIESTLPLLMAELPRFGSDNPNTTWVVPRTEHAGSALALLNRTNPSLLPDAIYSYPYNHHPFALRYAFYRGLQPDSQLAGYEYPLATPTAFNAHGDRVGKLHPRFQRNRRHIRPILGTLYRQNRQRQSSRKNPCPQRPFS